MRQRFLSKDPRSDHPQFRLEFRCFDDGILPPQSDEESLTPPTTAPATFPAFQSLPLELRREIWSYLIQPRVIVVGCIKQDILYAEQMTELRGRENGSIIPVLLHVNREARNFALQHYELAFSWRISPLLSRTPVSCPARVYFNFDLDGLYLMGELETYDDDGVNNSMVYFLRREDTRRVKNIACAILDTGYPELSRDQVFGCLWHVVDTFRGSERLLLGVNRSDGEYLARQEEKWDRIIGRDAGVAMGEDNEVQNIWNGWMGGMTVTGGTMADKKMIMVKETELAEAMRNNLWKKEI